MSQQTELTDDQKRIRIAEFCGWTHCKQSGDKLACPDAYWYPPGGYIPPGWKEPCGMCHLYQLPDYLDSLDAIHEAEKKLTDEQYYEFRCHLYGFAIESGDRRDNAYRHVVSAAARQRAEALLRVIGKTK